MKDRKNIYNLIFYKKKKLTEMLVLFVVIILASFTNVSAENKKFEFDYTGDYQTFTAPADGTYKIQLWGAQGGASRENNVISTVHVGGYGAYTAGMIELKKGQVLYVYVGGKGQNGVKSGYATGGYNGGGRGDYDHSDDEGAGAGGGATDIRLTSGVWNDFASLKSRIMVAAGGGGTSWTSVIGHAGDLTSPDTATSKGATQTTGYQFGVGQNGVYKYSNITTGGGGGGYYGGLATQKSGTVTNGSGGSSFISGYDGVDAIDESSTSSSIVHTGQSIHYSGMKFDYSIMIRGNGTVKDGSSYVQYLMPGIDGIKLAQGTGKTGNGYAIIEYLDDLKTDDYPNYAVREGYMFKYAYTGSYQTFTAPAAGTYKLEAWGAKGGFGRRNSSLTYHGGYGAYAAGTIHLDKGAKFYVYVGQAGYNGRANGRYIGGYGGWNGGGKGGDDANHDSDPDEGGGGGGATDFRLTATSSPTIWNEFDSLKDRVLVAGAGSGGTYGGYGEAGALRLNQTNGYKFGLGQAGFAATGGSGGGGGGYFGGISNQCDGCKGYGGTSYVSGSSDDLAITADSTSDNITLKEDSIHYTGLTFKNPIKVNGNTAMPNGLSLTNATMTGNNNNGYARVTILELDNGYPQLKSLSVTGGTFKQSFDKDTYTYDVYVDSENTVVKIDGEGLNEDDVIFRGLGDVTLKAGENKVHIGLVNDLGNVTIYSLNIHRSKSNYKYLADLKIDGTSIENFDPTTLTYTVALEDTVENVNIEAIPGRPSQEITGDGDTEINFGTTKKEIVVVSEDGEAMTTYTINFKKSNSSKLKSLKIEDYKLDPTFAPDTLDYTVAISTGSLYVDVDAIPYDKSAKVTITGNGYIPPNKTSVIKILVEQENVAPTTYQVLVKREGSVENQEFKYECSGEYQEFTAPGTTYYKIQSWGARGGYGRTNWSLKYRGGYGAYTEGEIYLKKDQKLYIYVGCAGANGGTPSRYLGGAGGWNGGAKGGDDSNKDSQPDAGGGGGGATDIRLKNTSSKTVWNEFDSLKSRIMVAAGGGGGNYSGSGGAGGTLAGTTGYGKKSIPTQTTGYAFGYGMPGGKCTDGSGGAGGGYFGAYSGSGCSNGGGGGSSYVSGCEDCVGISEESTSSDIISSGQSAHYSSYTFENITMLDGTESMPSPKSGYITGNNDNGYVIITAGKDRSANNFLREITTDKGTLSPTFDMQTYEYNVRLDSEDDEITIGAKLEDDTATVSGIGTHKIKAGTTAFPITVTAENGEIRTYTVNVTREKSSNATPIGITISGLIPSLCLLNEGYCKLDTEFDPNTNTYNMTVPSRIKQLQFTVTKGHYYQTVIGDGVVSLDSGMNMITIEITSEDGTNKKAYTYNINRDMTGNANIENLEVVDPKVDINFDPDISEYYFSIPNENTSIELKVTLEDVNATYEIIGNENFDVGLNSVIIRVTAQNRETKDYILNVYREQSGNVFLSDLTVKNADTLYELNPTFNKIINSYTLTVPNDVDKVDIEATAEHNLTTIAGTGEKELKTGINKFNITTTAEDGSTEVYTVAITREKSNDATLKTLDVLEGVISPGFDKDTTSYQVEVAPGITSLQMNIETTSNKAVYKVVGNSGFKVGANTVNIVVTAENGNKKTYTIKVVRKASENTYLNLLTTDKYDMETIFEKEKETYDITVDNSVTSINVSAIAEDKLSKVVGAGKYSLKTGNNEINIVVTAESGDSRVYTLNVLRQKNSNANLLSITTDKDVVLNPEFDKDNVNYQIEVDNEIGELTVAGLPEVATTTVKGNGTYKLNVGENQIILETTAEDGSVKVYTININRHKSSNCNAQMIIAKESVLDPTFDKNITSYELRVLENVTSLNLIVIPDDVNATYEIVGNENFEIGNNIVKVIITAEDSTTKEYTLNVLRQKAGTTSNKLESLSMKEKNFEPEFSPDVLYYETTVPYSITKATLEGELDDKNATVTGLGSRNLQVGKNVLAVSVTSTEGVVRTYQVVVTREENDEARLSNLQVSGSTLSPIFNKDTYEYSITSTNSNLVIDATPIDKDATYEIINNSNLEIGKSDVIIRVTAKNKITTKDYVIHVDRKASDNNNLKSLSIDDLDITPEFSKTTTVYYATVPRDVNNIQINALAEDINATVDGIGNEELEVGKNYKEITVTSESGKTKVYTIIITRTPNDNIYLKDLTVSSGNLSPEFDKTVNNYNVEVPYDVEEILIDGLAEDSTSIVSGLDKYKLEVGENKINITVTSEAGTTNTYVITVTRKDIVSSKLKKLEVKNYLLNQEFNQDIYDYQTNIDYEVTSLDLDIETVDKNATYVVEGNDNFAVGTNTVTIVVTDSEGLTTTSYTLTVNRQNYSNTYLSYIDVSRGTLTPTFDKANLSYTVEVASDVEEIEILAEAEIESNKVDGTGVHKLNPGSNKIPITVTSNSGITRVYYVNVIRALKDDNYLESLQVKVNNVSQNLNPEFSKDTLSYTVDVPVGTTSATIMGTYSKDATITGLGTKTIIQGENKFNIVVTSESGNVKTYTIIINREASSDNYLTDLIPSVGTLEPSFSYYETDYTLKLDSSAALLSFEVGTSSQFATVEGIDRMIVPDGESTRKIVVTAEDKTTRIYTITVIKDRADEARLSSLSISGYKFNETFSKDTFTYTLTVPNSKKTILSSEVEAIPIDSNATVEKTSSIKLSSTSTNIYTVVVTAKDGFTKQNYYINIDREKSSEALLQSLKFNVGVLTPGFNTSLDEYTLTVPNTISEITKDNVEAIATDEEATVTKMEKLELTNKVNVYKIQVTSADKTVTKEYIVNVLFGQSNDATLKSLTTDVGTFESEFASEKYEYTVNVTDKTDSITINAETNDEKATILSGVGVHALDGDETTINVTVEAEDGTIKIYTIKVVKSITTERLLENISISNDLCSSNNCNLIPDFSEDVLDYSAILENEIEKIDINVSKKNQYQVVKYYDDLTDEEISNKDYSLKVGTNKIRIEVSNGVGDKTNYLLTIERKQSSNNYLKSLEITNTEVDLGFEKDKQEYFITIPNDLDKVVVNATTEVKSAYVKVSGSTYLNTGNNDVMITVTAENGDEREYIIHVYKSDGANTFLQSLTISSGVIYQTTPTFKNTIYDYTVKVPSSINKITIDAVPEVATTTVTGTGEKTLKTGINTFTIVTTSKEGVSSTYNIVITKEKSTKLYLKELSAKEGAFNETFDKEKTSYTMNVSSDVSNLDLKVVPEDSDVDYKIYGNQNFVTGKNKVLIVLTNKDKTVTTTYQIDVIRKASSNNYLKSLKVNNEELMSEEKRTFTEFEVNVSKDTDQIDVSAIAEDTLSKVIGTGKYSLDYGKNKIVVEVEAEDASIRTYTITVNREYDNDLFMITTNRGDLTPEFSPDTLDYYLDVERNIKDITIAAVASSKTATVEGAGYHELLLGENIFQIKVSQKDGTSKTYTLHITRNKSDNNYLKSLYIHEGELSPTFDKKTTSYKIEVPYDVEELTIDKELDDIYATSVVSGNKNLKLGENTVEIKVISEQENERIYTLTVIVQNEEEYSNRLKELTVSKGSLSPDFSKDTLSYTVTVPSTVNTITISGVLESVNAKVTGLGTHNLKSGRNEFPIVVTSKDNKTRTYSVIVYKVESSDARLKSVTFKEGVLSPLFDKDIDTYTMTVDSSVTSLTETVEPLVEGTTYEITGSENIQNGTTTVVIEATAGDGKTKKKYEIVVTKEQSTNNYLSSLSSNIPKLEPEFDKTNTGPYIINVDDTINSITLYGKAEDEKSTITGLGLHQINRGKNTINISVTSETGSVRTYTVIVNKALSSDNSLSLLAVSDGTLTPEFSKDILSYDLELDSIVDEITVFGIANNKNATVSGNGNYTITSEETTINIVVTAENGTLKTYTINVSKKRDVSSKLLDIKAREGVLSPEFDKNTLEYMITVPNEVISLNLSVVKEDDTATYEIEGNENFKVGANQVNIVVTDKNNNKTTYKLNVIRQTASSNYLSDITVSEGNLSPEFNKKTQYYEVTVDSNVDKITVTGILEDSSATIDGNGERTLTVGDNYIYLKVTSKTGVERIYTVNVIKKKSTNNYLKSLTTNIATLTPSFDKTKNDYHITALEGTNEIEISAIAEDEKAVVTGVGNFSVENGLNTYEIVVTAEDGSTNIYTITVEKLASSNNNIENIIPSAGVLEPNYSNSIDNYLVTVEEDVNMIDFDVILESQYATVAGNTNNYLNYGSNNITITVEAEDGSMRVVSINVIREKNITEIKVSKEQLIMAVGDTETITTELLPDDATNKEISWESKDSSVATVENGKITANKIGTTEIVVSSVKNSSIKKVITVNVINLKLISKTYEIRRDDQEFPYIIGAEQGIMLDEFISNLDNNPSMIHFYSIDGIEFTNLLDEKVKTGEIVKLEYQGKVYDQLYIAVRGEINGDGEINVKDYNTAVKHILKKEILEHYWFSVANVDDEASGIINVKDSNKIQNKILGKIGSLNQ